MTGTATLTVRVGDINDHAPDFTDEELNFVVPQSTTIGTELARIEGYDMDTYVNGAPFDFNWNCAENWCSDLDLVIEAGTGLCTLAERYSFTNLEVAICFVCFCL